LVNLDQIYRARNAGLCDLPQTRLFRKTRTSGSHIFIILELWNCLGSNDQLIIIVGDRALRKTNVSIGYESVPEQEVNSHLERRSHQWEKR
jgi:hypothetical protein